MSLEQQRHFHHYQQSQCGFRDDEWLDEDSAWFASTVCAMHDARNVFEWGLIAHFELSELEDDVYIVVEALRNSFKLIHNAIPKFVADSLEFADIVESDGAVREFWQILVVDGERQNTLVELNPFWRDGKLW